MLVVSWFIGCILCFVTHCFLFCRFNNRQFRINAMMIVCSIIMGVMHYIITVVIDSSYLYIRPYFMHLYMLLCILIMYKEKFVKTLITMLANITISFIAEFIYGFIAVLIFKVHGTELSWYGHLFSNIFIYSVTIGLSYIPLIKKLFTNIIDWYNKNEYKSLVVLVTLSVILFTFLLYNNFIKLLPNSVLWITNVFCIGVIFFVINYFKEKSNNYHIISEYDQLLDYVKKYEKVIDEKSKAQHEYKNQLILIKNMISKNNKKALNYIDEIYKEEVDDSNIELLRRLQYLPSGGLKGLIHYKIEDMIDKNINVFVDISPKIKNAKLNKIIDKNLKDISKIIGVYLDNAIEATLVSKEKYIIIDIFMRSDSYVFSFSNTYSGNIEISRIDKEGYTTKDDGKGYGLSLVKDIIDKNPILSQKREINGIYYVQKLYIKK